MNEKENPVDEILKDITDPKENAKEEYQKNSIHPLFALSKIPTNHQYDEYLDNILKEVSSIASYILENKDNIEKTLDIIETINNLSDQEKQELARQIDKQTLELPPDGTSPYDKDSVLCKSEGMTKIINTSETDLESFKKTLAFSMLTAPYSKALFTGKETEKVVPVNNYKTKETAEVLLRILPTEVTSSEYIKIENPLDEYDREIVNALHTIWESGAKRFTPQNVYESMTGSKTPVKKKLDEISSRVMKLDSTKVDIYLSDLFKKVYPTHKVPEKNQVILESRIINVDRIRWVDEYNKQTVQEGFVFLKEPTLTTVCKMCNYQITTVPSKMLSSPSRKISNTDTSVVLTNYLAQRIYTMKNEPKISRDILFDTIFKDNNMLEKSRTEINRIRTVIFSILDAWVEDKFIKKYETNPKGKKRYHSISIVL